MESNNGAWQGPEEVLLKIFSYLDVNDLSPCEAVCVAWRSYLNEGFYRTMLRKMAKSKDGGWRTWGRLVARRKQNGASDKDCLKAIQQVKSNWRRGKYQMHVKHCIESKVSFLDMDYDHFLVGKLPSYSERISSSSKSLMFLKTCEINTRNFQQSHKLFQDRIYSGAIFAAEFVPDGYLRYKVFQNRIFNYSVDGIVSVHDSKDGSEVCKLLLPHGGKVTRLFMDYRNRLVAFGYDFRKKPQLLVWQMSGQGKFTLIHQQSLERLGGVVRYVEMDDQYVVITVLYELKQSIYFLSNNTLKIEGSLNDIPIDDSYVYGSGLLFHFQRDCIRVLDVTLKKQVAKIQTPNQPFTIHRPKIYATSEYVIIHTQLTNQRNKSVLQIYNLEEIRHSKIEIREPFITIELPKKPYEYSDNIFVDETKIVVIEPSCNICISRMIDFS